MRATRALLRRLDGLPPRSEVTQFLIDILAISFGIGLVCVASVALAGAISAPTRLELPSDADFEELLLLLPQAASTSRHANSRAREREIRRI